jgi:hypothetical protein
MSGSHRRRVLCGGWIHIALLAIVFGNGPNSGPYIERQQSGVPCECRTKSPPTIVDAALVSGREAQ